VHDAAGIQSIGQQIPVYINDALHTRRLTME